MSESKPFVQKRRTVSGLVLWGVVYRDEFYPFGTFDRSIRVATRGPLARYRHIDGGSVRVAEATR